MTQRDHETVTIDGIDYRIRFLDPLTASDIATDLCKLLAPVFGALGGNVLSEGNSKEALKSLLDGKKDNDDSQGTSESIEKAIVGLLDRLSKEQVRYLIDAMANVTEVKQGDSWPELSSIFTIHFRGRVGSMYKWLAAAVRIQFKDFFSGMGSAITRAVQLTGQDQ